MSRYKRNLTKELFKDFIRSLAQDEHGIYYSKEYPIKYQREMMKFDLRERFWEDVSEIPTIEELCNYFEKEIVNKIPYAILIIKGNLSIEIHIDKNNNYFKKVNQANKEIDMYEAFKTLYFPTMKERLYKFSDRNPEWIYFPSKRTEISNLSENGNAVDYLDFIKFIRPNGWIVRPIKGAALSFLKEDIKSHLKYFQFRNPIPIEAITLPGPDISLKAIRDKMNRKKTGYFHSELYSYDQKLRIIKQLINDFIVIYPKIVEDNFYRIRKSFYLYSNLPVKIHVFTEKIKDYAKGEDIVFSCYYEKLPDNIENQITFNENQKEEFDDQKYILMHGMFISDYLLKEYVNSLPYTYDFLEDELSDVIEHIKNDTIFDDIKPFHSSIEAWINQIIEAEARGGEDYTIELKSIPTESALRNGSGNDLYGHINAFENWEGGYIFLGINENLKGIDKIVGIESYLRDNNKTIDQLKREIRQKCWNYLKKDNYRIEIRQYKEKTLIRIRIPSNNGSLSFFYTKDGSRIAYTRRNGEKVKMDDNEIDKRLSKLYL
ncbi:MAG: ATP-binding protein [Promethearchaeota archaeon]|nr:MAG: ATP-binding protein [Candidatus Lokiarchaeota archaeon]